MVGSNPNVIVVLKPRDSAELKKELAFSALVERIDQGSDLALLRIIAPPSALPFLSLGGSSSLNVGQDVHAIGHPQGEVWTYTRGIISQVRSNYEWKTEEGSVHRANVIQTQTPINPGSSRGPLLDDAGTLIGINSFQTPGTQGLNYAVSISTIEDFLARQGTPQVQGPPSSGQRLQCTEGYDSMRRGWEDIIGCYQDAVAPPPDVWAIFRSRTERPAYLAMDSDTSGRSGKIDLVKKGLDSQWVVTELYIDSDCNGTVDLITRGVRRSSDASSSRLPPPNLRLTALAKELDAALKTGTVPYRNLRVCQ